MDEVWELFTDYLASSVRDYGLRIHLFVLMHNHFHLVGTTPAGNLSEIMRHFMTETSREITRLSGRINQTYGGPFYSSLIPDDEAYRCVYHYNYQNPLAAGLCEKVEDYPYSSLRGLLGLSRIGFPVVEDELLFSNVSAMLDWLNDPQSLVARDAIRKASRRRIFTLPHHRETRRQLVTTGGPKKFDARATPKGAAHLTL